jgi:hypothetical protein
MRASLREMARPSPVPSQRLARPSSLLDQLLPQHVQDKNSKRAEQPKQREERQKSLRSDEAQRWVHGESLCDDANRTRFLPPNANELTYSFNSEDEAAGGCSARKSQSFALARRSARSCSGAVPAAWRHWSASHR